MEETRKFSIGSISKEEGKQQEVVFRKIVSNVESVGEGPVINSLDCLLRFFGTISRRDTETFYVFYLDVNFNCLGYTEYTQGAVDICSVNGRDILKNICLNGAQNIIITHNHPSGNVTPSLRDIESFQGLRRMIFSIEGLTLIDFVIVSGDRYLSFAGQENMDDLLNRYAVCLKKGVAEEVDRSVVFVPYVMKKRFTLANVCYDLHSHFARFRQAVAGKVPFLHRGASAGKVNGTEG